MAAGQQITVTMTASADEDFDIALWPPGTTDLSDLANAVAVSRNAGSNESYAYTVPAGADGTYYIDVWSFSSAVTDGSYHLTVAIGEPSVIAPIPSVDFSDALEAPGYEDCWTVDAAPGQQLIITMAPPSGGDFDLCLWAPGTTDFTYHYSESLVISAHYSGAEDFKYIVPAGAGGAYIVDVWSDTLGGTYRLRVNKQSPSKTAVRITPPAVPLRCVTGSQLHLVWHAQAVALRRRPERARADAEVLRRALAGGRLGAGREQELQHLHALQGLLQVLRLGARHDALAGARRSPEGRAAPEQGFGVEVLHGQDLTPQAWRTT